MVSRGMTLIEVLVALLITTVGLLGALAMVISLLVGSTFTRNSTEALTLAQSKVEQINSQAVTLASPADGTVENESLDALGNPATVASTAFTRTTTWSTNSAQQTRRVAVLVSWVDRGGRTHGVTVNGERIP